VTANLPPQLWIKSVEVKVQSGAANQPKRPVVEIKGSGKELDGVDASKVLFEFSQKLRSDPLLTEAGATATLATQPDTGSVVQFGFTITFGGDS